MDTYWFVYITIILVALVQIPIAIDMLRFIFPKWKLARLASRAVHLILFSVMGSIFCIGLSYHLFIFLPLLAGHEPLKSLQGLAHTATALWIWVNIVGNYYYSVYLHPGVDKDYKQPSRESKLCVMSESGVLTEVKPGDEKRKGEESQPFYCDSSLILASTLKTYEGRSNWVPNRTHYCKICDCPIPYLDHHCPFTGNCAGLRNYSNFFIGLCYGTLGLFYAVVITLPYFFECDLKKILWYFGLVSTRESSPVCGELGPHSHIFIPVFAGFFLSANMVFLQVLFLMADLSTYNILSMWSKAPMLRIMLERMKAGKFRDKNSRLNVLIRNQRKYILSYFIPVKNSSQL